MIVANQNGNTMLSYRINEITGSLTNTGQSISIPNPLAVEFLPSFNNTFSEPAELHSNEKDFFQVYPNPADGRITISMDHEFDSIDFTLYNATGGVVGYLHPDNSGETNLPGLPDGLYFLKGCWTYLNGSKAMEQMIKPLFIIRN
jgi:hypothetical protein